VLVGRAEGLDASEAVRVDRGSCLGQHLRLSLGQQPAVGGADDLAADQQQHSGAQIPTVMGGCVRPEYQVGSFSSGMVGATVMPSVLPGGPGLGFEPVQ